MEKDRIESLVNHAQSGDLQAMEKLLEVAHTSVSYQCRKMMPRQEDAEDLTQEVLLAVYQKIDTLKEAKAFWSWLHRITATHCMNALSRNHVDLQFAEDEEGHSVVDDLEMLDEHSIPDKALDNAETARMIDEIVSGLPEAQRMSTLMYYYNEMSVKEIAQIMNVPENTVKSRLNLARKAIKDKVLDYEKQGVKLYSVSILPFIWYFLRNAAEYEANSAAATACVTSVLANTTGTVSAAVSTGSATAAAEGITSTGSVWGMLSTKLIAGIVAGTLVIGGGIFAISNIDNAPQTDIETEAKATETSIYTTESTDSIPPEEVSDSYIMGVFYLAQEMYDKYIYGRDFPVTELSYTPDNDIVKYNGCYLEKLDDWNSYDHFMDNLSYRFSEAAVSEMITQIQLADIDDAAYCNLREGVGDPIAGEYNVESVERISVDRYRLHISFLNLEFEHETIDMYCIYEDGDWVIDGAHFYGE